MVSARDIQSMRDRMGLTKPEFAKLTGVDARTVYRWERGESKPKGGARSLLIGLQIVAHGAREPSATDCVLKEIGQIAAVGGPGFLVVRLAQVLASQQ